MYCAVNSMACANERSPHPSELFGADWLEWGSDLQKQSAVPDVASSALLFRPMEL
jgi:hypothetical protein